MSAVETPTAVLLFAIVILTMASAYFSGSETAMMALNRYRLKHLVKQKHRGARKANRLLRRPDRLLGVILIGNNLVNNIAVTVAAVIGLRLFGDTGLLLAPFIFTVFILIFAEVAPKTVAAERPEAIAFPSAYVLGPLLKLLQPMVVFVNAIANFVVRPFMRRTQGAADDLSVDELRTVVNEGAEIGARQNMLLGILDLEKVTVDDIMVPRSEITGIDIDDDNSEIEQQILTSQHTRLPVFRDNINNILGVLHLRRAARFMSQTEFNKAELMAETDEPYFVPEQTPLHTQLLNFQKTRNRIALVVDEYGDVQGIVTLEDILEEIVGEFTTDFASDMPEIHPQEDGAYYIEGMAVLRDINRALGWDLPTDGPRTLNGLVLEHLEFIPDSNVCLRIDHYLIETLQIKDNVVRNLRIQRLEPEPEEQDELDDD
ncbi:MAG: HlyC/CorC family transporter [Gammaproteobacteria bacterium]|nr:HlyC/CorC family transporter [Gammaproteobacteria bacterium]